MSDNSHEESISSENSYDDCDGNPVNVTVNENSDWDNINVNNSLSKLYKDIKLKHINRVIVVLNNISLRNKFDFLKKTATVYVEIPFDN